MKSRRVRGFHSPPTYILGYIISYISTYIKKPQLHNRQTDIYMYVLVAGKGSPMPKWEPSKSIALQVVRSQCPPGRCIDEPSKSCWKTSLKIVGMKVIVRVEMNVHVKVEFIATNVRPIRSEDFEQSIRQCAWFHRDVLS